MKLVVHVVLTGLFLLVSSCSLVPSYHRPEAIKPGRWKNRIQTEPTASSSLIPANWWKKFGSAELDRLVLEALNNNLDLAAAMERISQFRALAKIAGAPLWPAISATGNFNFRDGTRTSNTNLRISNSSFISSGKTSWTGQWNLSYEVDLWGGIRAGRDSAENHLATARYTVDALRLVVMGDVAQSYFTIVGLKERRLIAIHNLNNIQEILAIIIARFDAGGTSALEVAQQKSELANAEATVAQLDQQIAQSENALAVLLGRAPQLFKVYEDSLQAVVIPRANIPDAASILDHRPDIRGSETELIAAHADIGKARAAFYPRLQLGADNIFTAATMSQPAGVGVALATSLTAPIFQGGRLEGELDRTLARRTELLEIYRKTILSAYQEIEDALALGNQSTRRREQLLLSVDSAKEAYQIARNRYSAGATDYQTLLIVQRSLFNAQDNEIQAHIDVLTASVLLFKSLGGGWNS